MAGFLCARITILTQIIFNTSCSMSVHIVTCIKSKWKKKELKSNKVNWFLVEEQTLGWCLTFLGNVNLDLRTQWKGGLSWWMLYTDWGLSNKSVKMECISLMPSEKAKTEREISERNLRLAFFCFHLKVSIKCMLYCDETKRINLWLL